MVYAEENRGKEKTSWPVRQTAVFNRFKPNSEGNLWIIVNPMPNAVLAQRLESLITERTQLEKDRYMQKLHLLSISSYIESSRWYLKALSEEFEDIVSSCCYQHSYDRAWHIRRPMWLWLLISQGQTITRMDLELLRSYNTFKNAYFPCQLALKPLERLSRNYREWITYIMKNLHTLKNCPRPCQMAFLYIIPSTRDTSMALIYSGRECKAS